MKNLVNASKYIVASISLWSLAAQGQAAQTTTSGVTDISILPMAGPNMSDVVLDSNLTLNNGTTTYLDLHLSCYGTNLRSVANPVSPGSMIEARIKYLSASNVTKTFRVTFPAGAAMTNRIPDQDLTSSVRVTDASNVTTGEVFRTQMKDGLIRVAMTQTKTVPLDVLASGNDFGGLLDSSLKSRTFTGIAFIQSMPAGASQQQYMGWNGPLTSSVRWYVAENGQTATVYASFPGQNGFCGGYFSPLMLKFKSPEVVPKMAAFSKFPLYESDIKNPPRISWPSFEKNEEVYFLVIDKNSNGKVDSGSELFGDINGYEDGFANLAVYDENKDGVIDAKDSFFEKLVLWKDSNHDGFSKSSEIKKLKEMGVESISLKFKKAMHDVGPDAKVMGPGEFSYVDKKGKSQSGAVWDVYMKSVSK